MSLTPPLAAFALAVPFIFTVSLTSAARGDTGQCWFDAMSDTEKEAFVTGYTSRKTTEGKVRATAWADGQKTIYEKRSIASGACQPPQTADAEPANQPRILNREGKTCKRIEMENQNVPNLGGAMGWALIPVCKD